MPDERATRRWARGNAKDKRAGVAAVLARAAHDRRFRERLLSKDPEVARAAFAEEGKFEALPPDFSLACFERAGTGDRSTDNVVVLTLPAPYELPEGGKALEADISQYWACTYVDYVEE